MEFTLPPKLGGLGWQPSEFNASNFSLVIQVRDEAIDRAKKINQAMKGKPATKKSSIKLPGEK